MINILISRKEMRLDVTRNNEVLKSEDLDKESFKSYMVELAGDNLEAMRKVNKLFKPTSYTFIDVKG